MGFSLGGGLAALNPVAAIGTLVGGGADILGSYMGKRSMDNALNQANLQNYMTLQQQKDLFDKEWGASAPWRASALDALAMRRRWMENPELSPITRLYMNEGNSALDKAMAAKGLSGSGAAVEAKADMISKYLAEDKAQRLNALNNAASYIAPGGAGAYGSAISNYGTNTMNNMLAAGRNRANFYGSVADTIGGMGQDMFKMAGYGLPGGGGGGYSGGGGWGGGQYMSTPQF